MIVSIAVCIESAVIKEHRNLNDDDQHVIDVASLQLDQDPEQSLHTKREVMFRPLFVYREQQIKKQHLKEQREQREQQMHQHPQTTTTHRPKKLHYEPYDYMG